MRISSTHLLPFSQQFKNFYTHQFLPLLTDCGLSIRKMDMLLFLVNNPSYDTARNITEFRVVSKSHVSQVVDLLAGLTREQRVLLHSVLEQVPGNASRLSERAMS